MAQEQNLDTSPEYIVQKELLFFDMSSAEKEIRLGALFQLYNYLNDPEVEIKIRDRIDREDDWDCRQLLFSLESLLIYKNAQKCAEALPLPNISREDAVNAFVEPDMEKMQLFLRRAKIDSSEQVSQAIAEILRQTDNAKSLLPLFSLPEKLFSAPPIPDTLEKFLDHPDPFILARTIQLLFSVNSQVVILKLPTLLVHELPAIRGIALRLLYKVLPQEALRLVEELVHHKDPGMAKTGFGLMFIIPFEDISPILLDMIENGELSPPVESLVKNLVRSNPDHSFLTRLLGLSIRSQANTALLQDFIRCAAEALLVSGLETGTPEEIMGKFRKQERSRMEISSGIPILDFTGPEKKPDIPEPVQPPGPVSEAPLEKFSSLAVFSDLELAAFEKILPQLKEINGIDSAIALIRKQSLKSQGVITWLTTLLDAEDPDVISKSLFALEEIAPKEVTPQLPILAYHASPRVVVLAIRLLRKRDGATFLKRIQKWLKDGSKEAREAAVAGLVQIEFPLAKDFIISQITQSTNLELLSQISKVLLMNPDPLVLHALENIPEVSGSKGEFLAKLRAELAANLNLIQGKPAQIKCKESQAKSPIPAGKKWNNVVTQIKAIRYQGSSEPSVFAELVKSPGGKFLLFFFVGIFLLGITVLFSRSSGDSDSSGKKPSIAKPGNLAPGQVLKGVIHSYDGVDKSWRVKTQAGALVKVDFGKTQKEIHRNDKVEILIEKVMKSPSGETIVEPAPNP